MNRLSYLIRWFLISMLMLVILPLQAQFATRVVDYNPAPGQYTNAEFIGTPAAAGSLVNTNHGLVSLGAYGGSVVLEFASGIKNDPNNPYGVDFTIFGNPTPTWSEPGIVQVMKDENHNGLADDTWYEIAGSDHLWNTTTSNYEVTYFNSGLASAVDINWEDNQGKTGKIPANSFHLQSYYPQAALFPQIATDKYTLKGTRLKGQIDLSIPGVVSSYHRAFGYADNTPVISLSEKLPDNPYTSNVEGSGGDAIDISWAVDQYGKHVALDEIRFIRITTGMNALVGWLGEVSTEITGIRDVEPAMVNGANAMIVVQDLLPKLRVGESVPLQAIYFESGIKVDNAAISWSVSNPEVAAIENGLLKTLKSGTFHLRASLAANSNLYTEKDLEVYSAGKAIISLASPTVKMNDKLELTGKLTDQNGNILPGITPLWRTGNQAIAEVIQLDGSYFIKGLQTGTCWIYLECKEIATLRDSVQIQVLPESIKKKVFICIKTEDKTLIARHSMWVETMNFTSHVDKAQKSYALTDTSYVSLADAIAMAYQGTDLENEWAFRDDAEGGSALYLWRLPENDEGSTVYHFGYGGSRSTSSYRKTWIVMLNQQAYVSGLNKVKVNNNDEILIYHIQDNMIPWTVTQISSATDSLKVNQSAEFQLMNYSCSMNQARMVSINSSEVLVNQVVKAEPLNLAISSDIYTTDEYGKVNVSFEHAGLYGLISGIDYAQVVVELPTGNSSLLNRKFTCNVYPIPFHDKLVIKGNLQNAKVEITDIFGKTVYVASGAPNEINLHSLTPGIYVLKVRQGYELFQQKLLKQ